MIRQIVVHSLQLAVPALMFSEQLTQGGNPWSYFRRRPGLMVRSVLSIVVFVPALTLLVVRLVAPPKPLPGGLVLLSACAVAPVVLSQISRFGGAKSYAASLQPLVAVISIVSAPACVFLMSRALGFGGLIAPWEVTKYVLMSLVVPVLLGAILAKPFPRFAAKVGPQINRVAWAVVAVAFALIAIVEYRVFAQLHLRSLIAIALVLLGSLGVGHLLGGGPPDQRTALALLTASRNPAVAVLIAAKYFPDAKVAPVLLPYLLAYAVASSLYGAWRKRKGLSARRPSMLGPPEDQWLTG